MIAVPDFQKSHYSDIEKLLGALSRGEETDFHESMTKEDFHGLVNEWIDKLEVRPNRIQLRKMKNKWASCSSRKNVVFNTLLMDMPKEFVEYVICHDILHLKVPRHSKLFRNLLSTFMPDWKERVTKTIDFFLKREIGKNVEEIEALFDHLNSKKNIS